MKYIYDEEASDGHKRLVFALGHQEAIIIYELLLNAKRYMPKTPETQFDRARINNMQSELVSLMKKLTKLDYTENDSKKLPPDSMAS